MKIYDYRTDAESGEIEAATLQAALASVSPTQAQLADGAWAWVEDRETGERLSIGL